MKKNQTYKINNTCIGTYIGVADNINKWGLDHDNKPMYLFQFKNYKQALSKYNVFNKIEVI